MLFQSRKGNLSIHGKLLKSVKVPTKIIRLEHQFAFEVNKAFIHIVGIIGVAIEDIGSSFIK